jgi:hypothetical protein
LSIALERHSSEVAAFAVDMLERNDAPHDFLRQVYFSDEAMFHVNTVLYRYNCRIWGNQNPHVSCELERGSLKVNVWTGLMDDKSIEPIFISGKTVTGHSYFDMLELYALPQLPPRPLLQQDGEPPNFCHYIRNHLDREMAGR